MAPWTDPASRPPKDVLERPAASRAGTCACVRVSVSERRRPTARRRPQRRAPSSCMLSTVGATFLFQLQR